ncbi:MAG TPA: beta-1,6-N-acetylglucosaminyltransferase [Azoarcus taiwanensis]|nr:beta-1,6-N-acetylglucosaminyltransferase [Azoarcus taiwanensis]
MIAASHPDEAIAQTADTREVPLNRVPHKFVYLILSHGEGVQLARLIHTLKSGSPDAAVVIHHDAKGELPENIVTDASAGVYLVTPRIKVVWGEFSLLEAILHSLEFISTHINFRWVSLISEQDYPAMKLDAIERELEQTSYDAFIRSEPVTWKTYAYRYSFQYFRLPRNPYAYRVPALIRELTIKSKRIINRHQNLLRFEGGVRGASNYIGIRYPKNPFTASLVCHKGSTWFAMSSRAINYLQSFEVERPEVLAWYKRTWVPDESYFQTVIRNAKTLSVCDDHRRFIKWDAAHLAHPKTLTIKELPEILRSGKHFARKVDARVDAALLDELDRVVLG